MSRGEIAADTGPVALNWSDLTGLGEDFELGDPPRHDDVAAVLYSSGTTGRPKGIMLSHAHVYSFGEAWINTTNLQAHDVLYSPLSLFYMQPMILGVIPTLLVGAQVHIAPRFRASRYWQDIRETQATIAHSQFTLIPLLLKQPAGPLDREHRCTRLFIGKSNEEFEQRFGVRLIEIYGSTESNLVCYSPWDAPRAGSAGKASPAFEVRIVDDDDRELPQGETGEIVFRPKEPLVISYGYLNDPGATLAAWRNMWFHLGDLGYFDEDGYLFFVGRKKDVIRRKGENISAVEVERQVNSHPAVSISAAVPIPDSLAEEEVKIFVVLEQGTTLEHQELLDHLTEIMPKFMLPRYIEFVPALPMTPSMKIEKATLKATGLTPATWDSQTGRLREEVTA
jgi:crotonobetaine/carnitine-CoA ligase